MPAAARHAWASGSRKRRALALAGVLRTSSGSSLARSLNDVAHVVHLALARDVACDPAGILDVLLTVEHLPDGLRLLAHRVPQVHREDQRVLARIVVEDHLGRRVGEDAAVPIELAVDAHRRETPAAARPTP